MRPDIFKAWLEEKGCRFDGHEHERGEGHASIIVKLGNRRSVLPLVGTHQDLDVNDVSRILQDLDLDDADIPSHIEGGQGAY